jgi:hypothetical protein
MRFNGLRHLTAFGLLGLLAFAGPAVSDGVAQNLQNGSIRGVVRDQNGDPLYDAVVTVSGQGSGFSWTRRTDRNGVFRFSLLAPGSYDVYAETLGYRPRLTRNVPVLGGAIEKVDIYLIVDPPPVVSVDTVSYVGGVRSRTRPGVGQWASETELRSLPDRSREFLDVTRLSSASQTDGGFLGLPGAFTGLIVDGSRFRSAMHPNLSSDAFRTSAFPRSSLAQGFLLRNPRDTEWSSAAGGFLVGQGRGSLGGSRFEIFGDWTGDAGGLWSSDFLDKNLTGNSSYRGGITAAIPIVQDTTTLVVGFEGWNLELPRAAPLGGQALYDELLDVLDPADQPRFDDLQRARLDVHKAYSGFARLDWAVSRRTLASVRVNLSGINEARGLPIRGNGQGWDRVTVEGGDLSASAYVVSEINESVGVEIRAGFGSSTRDYLSGEVLRDEDGIRNPTPATTFAKYGLGVGSPATAPGSFSTTSFNAMASAFTTIGAHTLRGGLAADYMSYDNEYLFARTGQYFFTDPRSTLTGEGWFAQTDARAPGSSFSTGDLGVFLQDSWEVSPGFTLVVGGRFDYEQLPSGDIVPDPEWLRLTGTPSEEAPSGLNKFSSRLNLVWDVGQRGTTFVQGGLGVYHDMLSPGMWNEILTANARPDVRRAVGDLTSWPELPDADEAPVVGVQHAILGPDPRAPQTSRVSLGLSHRVGSATWLHVGGSYRKTDFLPRKTDLNLSPSPVGTDQFGRPIYGELQKIGQILAPTPGSNRRFLDYDVVWAMNTTGVSENKSLILGIEQGYRDWLDLFAEYTYSETTDDWFGARDFGPGGLPSPFQGEAETQDWTDGVSDFDVPHQVVASLHIIVPQWRPLSLSGVYRYASGLPFTPGFASGVDANGDYVLSNDPAYVPDTPEIFPLADKWGCIQDQLSTLAARNSCRPKATHSLDLRAMVTLENLGRGGVDFIVDWMNVIEPAIGLRDTALLTVDPAGDIVTDPGTGQINLPLQVNPNFGRIVVGQSPGQFFRLGIRARF